MAKGIWIENVQKFSPEIEKDAEAVLDTLTQVVSTDIMFGNVSGDRGFLALAAGVPYWSAGNTHWYGSLQCRPKRIPRVNFSMVKTPTLLQHPQTWLKKAGYFSVTLYSTETKLLMPNPQKIYDRTTYSAEPNKDGSYTITLSPDGKGKNGIPTAGKPFYIIIRAYVPTPDVDLYQTKIEKQ